MITAAERARVGLKHDDLFRSYIANHAEFRGQLENTYNRNFKTHIQAPVKTYPVKIEDWRNPGTSGGKEIKPHQWQSIHHLYRQGRGISALGTGFGKTLTAIGLMSLMRQEGTSKRVWLQVPNNKVKDWITEIKDVMPNLKIASIDPEEPGYSSRDRRYAKYQAMARSNADIVIMPESAAGEIQLSAENNALVTSRVAALYRMEHDKGSERQQQLAELRGELKAQNGKTNLTISFEDFGCDTLIVDEAHRYKNLFSSNLSRETGMNDGRQSAKAMSLFKKSEYIREKNDGKNVFLLTATPLTNSPLEYYNMLQYVAPDELQRLKVNTIDSFIRKSDYMEVAVAKTNAERQAAYRARMKASGQSARLIWLPKKLETPSVQDLRKPRSRRTAAAVASVLFYRWGRTFPPARAPITSGTARQRYSPRLICLPAA